MLVEAEIWTVARTDQGNAILIRPLGAEVAVPIFIGQLEAQSILIGLGNVPMPRPYTHDLFISLLNQSGMKLDKVEIISLKEGVYFAQLVLSKNEGTIILDSRPSDSIALAVRPSVRSTSPKRRGRGGHSAKRDNGGGKEAQEDPSPEGEGRAAGSA
jgi:bifunctional DNase/RNase